MLSELDNAKSFLMAAFLPAIEASEGKLGIVSGIRNQKCSLTGVTHKWFALSGSGISEAIDYGFEKCRSGCEVYYCCAVHDIKTPQKTRTIDSALLITMLWADIDFHEMKPNSNYPQQDAVHEYFKTIEKPPSAIIETGNGIHAYWYLNDAIPVDKIPGVVSQWQDQLRYELKASIDRTGDMARILRLPGTTNFKGLKNLPIKIITNHPDRRYDIVNLLQGQPKSKKSSKVKSSPKWREQKFHRLIAKPLSREDRNTIQRARKAKNGSKFRSLFDGGWEELDLYKSPSEARFALLIMLLFWTNGDKEKSDSLFRHSALYTEKWNRLQKGRSFGEIELDAAEKDYIKFLKKYENKDVMTFICKHSSDLSSKAICTYLGLIKLEVKHGLPPFHVIFAALVDIAKESKVSVNTVRMKTLEELQSAGLIKYNKGTPAQKGGTATEVRRIPLNSLISKLT